MFILICRISRPVTSSFSTTSTRAKVSRSLSRLNGGQDGVGHGEGQVSERTAQQCFSGTEVRQDSDGSAKQRWNGATSSTRGRRFEGICKRKTIPQFPTRRWLTSEQQLGDCLGKGAFGSVYRALNWGTGETVAIKQVRLADLPKTELKSMMVCFFCSMSKTNWC